MKIYRVVAEPEGARGSKITRMELRFAAETIQQVWEEIAWLLNDQYHNVIAVIEEAPSVTVLVDRRNT